MKRMNVAHYAPCPTVSLPGRTWPDAAITRAPRWCSVDLRDGNQALAAPMGVAEKTALFRLLVELGFGEIEVAFPASSLVEYAFVRGLIEQGLIPPSVTIQVLTQARPPIIARTMAALAGAERAIVNLCNPVSPVQREVVLRQTRRETVNAAVEAARLIRRAALRPDMPAVTLEYCPESFTAAEPAFALEVCAAVIETWQPRPDRKMIINLAASVELSSPSLFADRVEWFCRHVPRRDALVISVHTHNDRGTAVAAAELALMAGAERVEGTLFGNGERSGNMDTVTLALNLLSQGVDPCLDLTDVPRAREVYSRCTGMAVPLRHPYAGDLSFTAFSGAHQDAISKGLAAHDSGVGKTWQVPYLPIDPRDIGRGLGDIIRITSQSGSGGAVYVLEKKFGIAVPRWFQADLGRAVQARAEAQGGELLPPDVIDCFQKVYLENHYPYRVKRLSARPAVGAVRVRAELSYIDTCFAVDESDPDVAAAFLRGISAHAGGAFRLAEQAAITIARETDVLHIGFICLRGPDDALLFGAGIDTAPEMARAKAVVCAVNHAAAPALALKRSGLAVTHL